MPAFWDLFEMAFGCLFAPPTLLVGAYFAALFGVPWVLGRSADVVYAVYARIVGIAMPERGYRAEDTSFGAALGWFSVVWVLGGFALLLRLGTDREFMTWLRTTAG